jgi:hypothetical protein
VVPAFDQCAVLAGAHAVDAPSLFRPYFLDFIPSMRSAPGWCAARESWKITEPTHDRSFS